MNNGIIFKENELSNLLSGNIILNEAYFGKTKELLAAEQQLDKFRNKYMGKYVLNTRINSDADLLEFDRIMEQIFGFGCFTIHIHNEASCNAFTTIANTSSLLAAHSSIVCSPSTSTSGSTIGTSPFSWHITAYLARPFAFSSIAALVGSVLPMRNTALHLANLHPAA